MGRSLLKPWVSRDLLMLTWSRAAEGVENPADFRDTKIKHKLEVRVLVFLHPMRVGVAEAVDETVFDPAAFLADSAVGHIVDDPVNLSFHG